MDRRRGLLSVKEKKINTFTVRYAWGATEQFQFEDGMTWEEYCNSGYNDGRVTMGYNGIYIDRISLILGGKQVLPTDVIFNTVYFLGGSGGS